MSDVASFAEADPEEGAEDEEEETWETDWSKIRGLAENGGAPLQAPAPTPAPSGVGRAYEAFGGGTSGLHACSAVDALCEVGAIDTLLSNFIVPLQEEHIATRNLDGSLGRVHCSLNINTETGRLSARRPNLQNQPALEKDRYKVCLA